MIELLPGVLFSPQPSSDAQPVSGSTSSRDDAEGRRWSWELRVPESQFAIWETLWSTGERELVLADQEVTSTTPISVAKLMSRRRALVEQLTDGSYIAARQVLPDADDWPRFSNCTEADMSDLIPPQAASILLSLGYVGHGTRADILGSSARNRNQIVGLFKPESRAATVGFYILTRVVPTFRKAGMV